MPRACWHGCSARAALEPAELLRLVPPACASAFVCWYGWWSSEALVLSARLWLPEPEPAVRAYALLASTASLSALLPIGLGMALTVRAAHALGAGRPCAARRTILVAALLNCGALAVLGAWWWLLGGRGARAWFDGVIRPPEAVDGAAGGVGIGAELLPWLLLVLAAENLKEMCHAVLYAAGRQGYGTRPLPALLFLRGAPRSPCASQYASAPRVRPRTSGPKAQGT
jgi:hypothetical protein